MVMTWLLPDRAAGHLQGDGDGTEDFVAADGEGGDESMFVDDDPVAEAPGASGEPSTGAAAGAGAAATDEAMFADESGPAAPSGGGGATAAAADDGSAAAQAASKAKFRRARAAGGHRAAHPVGLCQSEGALRPTHRCHTALHVVGAELRGCEGAQLWYEGHVCLFAAVAGGPAAASALPQAGSTNSLADMERAESGAGTGTGAGLDSGAGGEEAGAAEGGEDGEAEGDGYNLLDEAEVPKLLARFKVDGQGDAGLGRAKVAVRGLGRPVAKGRNGVLRCVRT